MKRKNLKKRFYFWASTFVFLFVVSVSAQTTAFNFQGRLNDGANPATGNYDLRFKLFDAITGGIELGSIDRPNSQLINGVFSTALDFGPLAFQNGGDRFLEISVRPTGSPNAHVVLGARQQLLSVPFAARSLNSTNAVNAVNSTNATTAQNSLSLGGVAASGYARLNFANQGDLSVAGLETTGYISAGGNATQFAAAFGFPKAMVVVNENGTTARIGRCYNGVTGATTGNCGFTFTADSISPIGLTGVSRINFGFPVNNHFVSAIANYSAGVIDGGGPRNFGINYRFPSTDVNVIEFFTFVSGNSADTASCGYSVIVY